MVCIGDETIAAYIDGLLDSAAIDRAEAHFDTCAACRAQLSDVASAPVVRSFVDERPTPADARAGDIAARGDELVRGQAIGRYVVDSIIGRGAMGVVVRAYDPELDRPVAIKLVDPDAPVRPGGLASGGWRARLRAEARAMARLRHPNVVAVYDAGMFGDQMFVAMELIEGESLTQRLARDRHGILELCLGAGRGLCAAHAAGIVHGDVKPDNILIDGEGRALLGDFGLARSAGAHTAGWLVGTPLYMAPEQLRREPADERADQFAFAVTVHEAITGVRPWRATTLEDLRRSVETRPPQRPPTIAPGLWEAVARGLAADPAERHASMADFVAELERAIGEPATASQPSELTVSVRLDADPVTLVPGTIVGDYEIERQLGAGAMAHVYGARHERIRKRVAIKVMAPSAARNRGLVDRFEREAHALAQLSHPNIVDIISFGQLPDGRSYYVMDWLEGESLQQRIARGSVPLAEALGVLDQIARALAAAHERGVIHRDLKPGNVWLRYVERGAEPLVKLLDFGLAKVAADLDTIDSEPTEVGVALGTARYMSPEQTLSARDVGPATDVYALGCTAYEMICGRPPFGHLGVDELLAAQRSATPPPASSHLHGVPDSVDQLLGAMLDKDPGRRPSLVSIRATIAHMRAPAVPKPRHAMRRVLVIALIASAIAVIGAGAINSRSRSSDDPPPTGDARPVAAVPDAALELGKPPAPALAKVPPAETAQPLPSQPAAKPASRPKSSHPTKPGAVEKPASKPDAVPACNPYDRAEGC